MTRNRILRYLCFAAILFAFTTLLDYLFFTVSLPKEVVNTVAATTGVMLVEQWRMSRSSARK